ncbi:hypothetical protein [Capnocytophaga sputigena]|mgnify:CR=1 FL=1|uniref:hypothetical protein n=1 Tax=Capnocytophaga sputigena TaxID=1019 RepID=UPI00248EC605|nr:hypothetical protein [Capnocytophaga sputigena]
MNSIVLQATINEADYPIFLGLFEKFKVKTVLLKKKVGKRLILLKQRFLMRKRTLLLWR